MEEIVEIVISGKAQEVEETKRSTDFSNKSIKVARGVSFTFKNYTEANPNIDGWRDHSYAYSEVMRILAERDEKYHSIEIDSVTVTFYDIEKQAREFASERPNMSVSEAMNKMKELENMSNIRY